MVRIEDVEQKYGSGDATPGEDDYQEKLDIGVDRWSLPVCGLLLFALLAAAAGLERSRALPSGDSPEVIMNMEPVSASDGECREHSPFHSKRCS